jgi:hypothetical protein
MGLHWPIVRLRHSKSTKHSLRKDRLSALFDTAARQNEIIKR